MGVCGCLQPRKSCTSSRHYLMQYVDKSTLPCLPLAAQRNADACTVDDTGRSALMYAAWKGSLPCVEALLAAGAPVNVAELDTGVTALIMAAMEGHSQIAERLLVGLCAAAFALRQPRHGGACCGSGRLAGTVPCLMPCSCACLHRLPSRAGHVCYHAMLSCHCHAMPCVRVRLHGMPCILQPVPCHAMPCSAVQRSASRMWTLPSGAIPCVRTSQAAGAEVDAERVDGRTAL